MTNTPRQDIREIAIDDEIDLGALLGTLWRGKFWILLTALVGLFIGGWYAFFVTTPQYTAKATVALESRDQNVMMDIQNVVTGLSGDQATINTEIEVFRSLGLLEDLVQELDLVNDPEFNASLRPEPKFSPKAWLSDLKSSLTGGAPEVTVDPEAAARAELDRVIGAVRRSISISNMRQSYVFTITVTTESPAKSARIANTLAELYIEDQVQVKLDKTRQATEWLSGRVADLQVALEQAEDELKDFSSSTVLISPEGLLALNRQLKELRERRAAQAEENEMLTATLGALRAALASGDTAAFAEQAQDRELSAILAQWQEAQTSITRERLDARMDAVVDRMQAEQLRNQAQVIALDGSIREAEQRIETQSAELVRLQQLQREAEASRLIYEAFLSRLKETSIQQGIQQADSRVLSQAVVPVSPSAPRKSMILALSLILGSMVGAGVILVREMMQNTFRVAEDLEARTGYAVLGQIPVIPARKRKGVLKYMSDKPNSAVVEAIRNLRTSILLANLDHKPQIILSTSSIPGEGKTTQSLALAQNFAGLGEKVLLIEGDIRRRVFREYFDIKARKGFLSVLSGDVPLEEAVHFVPDLQADLLIGEKSSVNAADLYSSEKFASFLKDLRKRYDRIIIDSPPVLAVPDARIIGQSVDSLVYTVKWDSTTHRQVLDGLRSLEMANVHPSGLVLGQIDKRGMKRYGYGDSYGAYHAYYDS